MSELTLYFLLWHFKLGLLFSSSGFDPFGCSVYLAIMPDGLGLSSRSDQHHLSLCFTSKFGSTQLFLLTNRFDHPVNNEDASACEQMFYIMTNKFNYLNKSGNTKLTTRLSSSSSHREKSTDLQNFIAS